MYSTELMEQILTSEIGQQIIQRVTNKYGNSYVGLWLFQIIGMSNDEVKAMVEDFKKSNVATNSDMVFIIMGAVNGLAC